MWRDRERSKSSPAFVLADTYSQQQGTWTWSTGPVPSVDPGGRRLPQLQLDQTFATSIFAAVAKYRILPPNPATIKGIALLMPWMHACTHFDIGTLHDLCGCFDGSTWRLSTQRH
jgi:hypothetical protein